MSIELGQDVCPAEDDNGVKCTNLMTHEEQEQDGMCTRCANLLAQWIHNMDEPFLFKESKSNDALSLHQQKASC